MLNTKDANVVHVRKKPRVTAMSPVDAAYRDPRPPFVVYKKAMVIQHVLHYVRRIQLELSGTVPGWRLYVKIERISQRETVQSKGIS